MERKYYVWKDPACGGIGIEWVELSGREFYAMVKRAENKSRRFIRLSNDICEDADIITIEATEQEYAAWKQEQNAHEYRSRQWRGVTLTSFDSPITATEVDSLHETVGDECVEVEEQALVHMDHSRLALALKALNKEETRFLVEIYVQGKSIVQMAKERGVSQPAVSQMKKRLLKKLKKFF